MKRQIIITAKQLKESLMREDNTINISAQAKDNNISSFTSVISDPNTTNDLAKAGMAGDPSLIVRGPKQDDSQPQQDINVAQGQSMQDALADQGNDALIRNGGSVKFSGDGMQEGKAYTKNSLEELRMMNAEKNGKVYTKKQLDEEFENDNISREDLINYCKNNDFLFIMENPLTHNTSIRCANVRSIVAAVVADLESGCKITPTHAVDNLVNRSSELQEGNYVVFEVLPDDEDKYYIIYEKY